MKFEVGHGLEPLAWVVLEDAIKNRQNGFDQPGHGAGDVVHLGIRFLALRCFDQLRPDALPVVGAQVLARYCAFGGLLDRIAVLSWDRIAAVQPVPDMLLLDSDRRGERRLTSDDFNCAFECFHKFSTLQQMFG